MKKEKSTLYYSRFTKKGEIPLSQTTRKPKRRKKMKDYTMVLKYADTVLGRILTNHALTIDEALDLLDIDMDKYAAEQGWEGWDYEQLSLELEEEKND